MYGRKSVTKLMRRAKVPRRSRGKTPPLDSAPARTLCISLDISGYNDASLNVQANA